MGYGTKPSSYTDLGPLREQESLPRTWLLATVASGLRRSGPPEWTWSDRAERSPPERATRVELERLLTIP